MVDKTPTADIPSLPTPLEQSKAQFIRRWGEMGGYWGINRTMAEIHALLFVSTEPICTDDVMAKLMISRGNASMNLRSLVDWGLIERIHLRGDRKEYFVCRTDVWEMFETIVRQRRRREVEPIVETIEHCKAMVNDVQPNAKDADAEDVQVYKQRLDEMHKFLDSFGTIVDLMVKLGPGSLQRLSGMMTKLVK